MSFECLLLGQRRLALVTASDQKLLCESVREAT